MRMNERDEWMIKAEKSLSEMHEYAKETLRRDTGNDWRDQSCGNCSFEYRGYCRRFPPTHHYTSAGNPMVKTIYTPVSHGTAACAEFKDRRP